ncbi:phosphomannose isomerase [Vibrio orientalis CIP 102891 = ATCC 33934]|uniref:Mannose-6-phosphate isomerase n=1 Tax=Vibrio orientalis CIP 102891 = ATCC 33934 TaxID=675816 RepID=C9QGD8_VIBOR|nr:mannose-6-phosphate isomerase, class I [Vibrio orientalis]EEX94820.1 mannose-6-phosphate isomerase [Vibrio orientalis CIP 102891 = ATCC 33934]EGU53048.1 phosphomannose isomerase [Vibrio orientalis CIP 102891 = ATCC 33934]
MSLFKLNNVIQNYAWGSKESISKLFGIDNSEHQPQAEIWMGAHPNGCSRVASTGELLSDVIAQDSKNMFGDYTARRFGELPYLFKVLAAETPLSIQVHPSKHKAEAGFARENEQGIALDSACRNYKDPNHKPELVYALTFYKAMNGFRPISQIVSLFQQAGIESLSVEVSALESKPNSNGLREFFTAVMSLDEQSKANVLADLEQALKLGPKTALLREVFEYVAEFKKHYPNDIGLLSPFILNTIELAPGEAMFLHAETPHAYVQGTGLEIMANSDNVLRAGLTPKHIDVDELIDNTRFQSTNPDNIKLLPIEKEGKLSYPIPVDDFGFDIVTVSDVTRQQYLRSAEILFCVEGEVVIEVEQQKLLLRPGDSVFISNDSGVYQCQGNGILARAYN